MEADDPRRMRMIDAVWLDIEQSDAPIAVGAVLEFAGQPPPLDQVRRRIADTLDMTPRLSQTLRPSRTRVRQAVWEPFDLDIEEHVAEVEVGNLEAAVSELLSRPMSVDRPLWDITLFAGYAPDEWALVWRLHHAVADGEGATMLVGRSLDLEPTGGMTLTDAMMSQAAAAAQARSAELDEADDEAAVGLTDRVNATVRDLWGRATRAAAATPATLRSLARLAPAPPTPISGHPSQGRDWRSLHLPLAEVKAAGKAHGATINDVLLAAVANGFRDVLMANGQMHPGRVVRAVMPVSTRRPGDARANNQVTMIPVELPVAESDPSQRLASVVRQTRQGKGSVLPQAIAATQEIVDRLVPAPVLQVVVSRGGWTVGWIADTLVTNVRGPSVPQYFLGQPVKYLSAIIPIGSALRTVVGINSYNGWVNVSVTGDAAHAEDNQILLAGIHHAVVQLGG